MKDKYRLLDILCKNASFVASYSYAAFLKNPKPYDLAILKMQKCRYLLNKK